MGKYLNKHFSKKIGKWLISTQKKTLSTFHHQRIANQNHDEMPLHNRNSRNQDDSKHWEESGEIGSRIHCWWECEMVQPFWKTVSTPRYLPKGK